MVQNRKCIQKLKPLEFLVTINGEVKDDWKIASSIYILIRYWKGSMKVSMWLETKGFDYGDFIFKED